MVDTNDLTMPLGQAPLEFINVAAAAGNTLSFPLTPPWTYRIVKTLIVRPYNLNEYFTLRLVRAGISYYIGYNQSNTINFRYFNTDFPIIVEPGTYLQVVDEAALNAGWQMQMGYYDYPIQQMQKDIIFKKGRRG